MLTFLKMRGRMDLLFSTQSILTPIPYLYCNQSCSKGNQPIDIPSVIENLANRILPRQNFQKIPPPDPPRVGIACTCLTVIQSAIDVRTLAFHQVCQTNCRADIAISRSDSL